MYSYINRRDEVEIDLLDNKAAGSNRATEVTLLKYASDGTTTQGRIRFSLLDNTDTDEPINLLFTTENTIDDLPIPARQENVPFDYIEKLQREHSLRLNYISPYVGVDIKVFDPVKKRKVVCLSDVLGVAQPSYQGQSENFTFAYLKGVFKAMKMAGYSSKSKEDLIDTLLEKFTEDAIQNVPVLGPCLVTPSKHRGHRSITRSPIENTEIVEDYKEAIGIASRIIGRALFLPNREPAPDGRLLEASYDLVEMVDPYDGFDDFLKEQNPKWAEDNDDLDEY